MGKLWTKCPRCRHLCHHEFADDRSDLMLLVGPDCDYCENKRSVVVSLGILAANLAIGAGLCAAFEMGRDAGPGAHIPWKTAWWRPGCGRPWNWPHVTRDDRDIKPDNTTNGATRAEEVK